jgi:hypothetical protein
MPDGQRTTSYARGLEALALISKGKMELHAKRYQRELQAAACIADFRSSITRVCAFLWLLGMSKSRNFIRALCN